MAHIQPTGWREVAVTGAAQREIETLALLEGALSDDYTVLHGVHWTKAGKGFSAYGEIDFIVIAPSGSVLLIEQKSGFLQETADGLVKTFDGKPKSVRNQILRTVDTLMTLYARSGDTLAIDYLLYCPDYQVRNPPMAGIDPARIIDSTRRDTLPAVIARLLPVTPPAPRLKNVMRFFGETLELVPDVSTMIGSATALVTRLSAGLATWARHLEFEPYRLRVIGTAGSGKTQLAIAEYRAAIDAGKRPLYVCYNRPLADHIATLVPEGGRVVTFHLLCDAFMREGGTVPDYADPGVWPAMEAAVAAAPIPARWMFDVVIVDEGQDFSEGWRDIVLRLLKPDGRAIWLEDPNQNLYARPEVSLPGWVTLRAATNFRNPRRIVGMLTAMGGTIAPIEAASPFEGADVDFLTYPAGDATAMLEQTKSAITRCLAAGFGRKDIALVSYRGRERSALLRLDQLGKHSLRSFTGTYDLFGTPLFREGELLAESVYRFKGQSAPAIVFTEIDFEALDALAFRKLFVGMTRARLKLILVLSERAAAILHERSR